MPGTGAVEAQPCVSLGFRITMPKGSSSLEERGAEPSASIHIERTPIRCSKEEPTHEWSPLIIGARK